jgi:hypothetical protein
MPALLARKEGDARGDCKRAEMTGAAIALEDHPPLAAGSFFSVMLTKVSIPERKRGGSGQRRALLSPGLAIRVKASRRAH